MRLEALVSQPEIWENGWRIHGGCLDLLPLFEKLLAVDAVKGANLFHGSFIAALAEWLIIEAQEKQTGHILLSGGCFLNNVLTEGLSQCLKNEGLKVYLPRQHPPNDGGIALGQAWTAGNQ